MKDNSKLWCRYLELGTITKLIRSKVKKVNKYHSPNNVGCAAIHFINNMEKLISK